MRLLERLRRGRESGGAIPLAIGVPAAVLLGALVSVQSRVSASLAERSDVYNAAWVTVITGTVILLVVIAVSAPARRGFRSIGSALKSRSLPWWALAGGLGGMFFVVTQGTAAGPLGLAIFAMAVVAGQVVGGLVFDWIGLAGGEPRHPTPLRVLGCLLAVAAVGWGAVAGSAGNIDIALVAMSFASGVGLAAASGLTGRLSSASSAVTAGTVNHLVGLLTIVTILLVIAPGQPASFALPGEPWLYVGGLIGVIGVCLGAVLVGSLGVLLLGLGMVAGQLIAGLVLELVAPTSDAGLSASTFGGIALTLVAVAITALDARRRAAKEPEAAPAADGESPVRARTAGSGSPA